MARDAIRLCVTYTMRVEMILNSHKELMMQSQPDRKITEGVKRESTMWYDTQVLIKSWDSLVVLPFEESIS